MTKRRNDTGEELEAVAEAAASVVSAPEAGAVEETAPASVTLVLTGANVLIADGRRFVKGQPAVVDAELAERLLKSGLFKRG